MTVLQERRLFTVADYHKMAEAGVFGPEERVELLNGEIRPMSPVGHRHAIIVMRLTKLLVRLFGDEYDISIQNPVILDDHSEPEPDATVVRRYEVGDTPLKPMAEDVFLLIEVSDSTLAYDRDEKLPSYARSEIPEVWIVDVKRATVAQYHTPRDGAYTRYTVWEFGDVIPCLLDVEIAVSDFVLKE